MAVSKLVVLLVCVGLARGWEEEAVVEHHTIRPPYIDNWWQGGVPYWNFGASAVVTDKFIRLTPDEVSRVGWAWNKEENHLESWEAQVSFKIHSKPPAADGLAIWYTKDPYHMVPSNQFHAENPHLVGNRADFQGLGVILDTYDNDSQRDNPVVLVVTGEGNPNHKWEIDNDISNQARLRCVYDFRNSLKPVTAKIVYHQNTLNLYLNNGNDNKETFCGSVSDIKLPTGYYFGVTAATGHLTDNHDLYSFTVKAPQSAAEREDQFFYNQEASP